MEKGKSKEVLSTVRNIRIRKNPKTEKYEVLLLKRRNNLYEFPGGKSFDSVQEFEKFKKLENPAKYKVIEESALRETEEEIGQNVSKEVLYFLGKHTHNFDRERGNFKFKDFDKTEFDKRDITYLVSFQEDPYAEIDLSNSDDDHTEFEWMPLEDLEEIMIDETAQEEFFHGKNKEFNRNSDITKLAKSVVQRVRGIIRRHEGEKSRDFIDEIIENDYIESDIYVEETKKKDGRLIKKGEEINMFDFNRFDLLSGSQRKRLFEKYWGKLSPSYKCKEGVPGFEEARENNKKILESFNWTLQKALGYIENHVGRSFPAELSQKLLLEKTEDIMSFLNGFGRKEWSQKLTQLFKVSRAYLHFKRRAPYAFDGEIGISKHSKGFNNFFRGIFEKKGKNYSLNFVGNGKDKFKINDISAANEKAEYRVIDKLITKSDLEFDNVQDIFRGRVVCDKKDINGVARTLKSKCNAKGISLKDKGATKNKNRGMVGVHYLVGKYRITEIIKGEEKKFMVTFEIQIIDPTELNVSKSETKHHDVYADKNNLAIRNTKVFGGTPKYKMDSSQEKHAKNPFVQDAKNLKTSPKKLGKKMSKGHFNSIRVIEKTKTKLVKVFDKIGFYTLDDVYVSYQEVLKNWGKVTGYEKWEKRMVAVLNKRAGISLKKEEWTRFFQNPQEFVEKTIYELEEKERSKEEIEKRVNRFKSVVSTLPGFPKF